ncbi:hypothetical protein D3C77_539500 [compost metagenome]
MHHAVVADLQRPRLFRVRHQQVLGQAPVEENAGTVDVLDLEAGELADLHLGLLGGGDQLVFAVQVDEHVQPVIHFGFGVFRDVAPGQQDLAVGAAVQVQAEVHVFHDLQTVVTPKQSHFR